MLNKIYQESIKVITFMQMAHKCSHRPNTMLITNEVPMLHKRLTQ